MKTNTIQYPCIRYARIPINVVESWRCHPEHNRLEVSTVYFSKNREHLKECSTILKIHPFLVIRVRNAYHSYHSANLDLCNYHHGRLPGQFFPLRTNTSLRAFEVIYLFSILFFLSSKRTLFSISGFKNSAKEYKKVGVGCQGTCRVKQSVIVPCGSAAPLARAGAEEEDKTAFLKCNSCSDRNEIILE